MEIGVQNHWGELPEGCLAEGFQKLWRTHSDAVNAALLNRWLPESSLGCILKTDLFDEAVHDGLIPSLIPRSGQLFCIDISFVIHQLARRRYPVLQTASADVRKLPFKAESFDGIVSNSTLDHFESMEELRAALQEIRRVMRPGGHLILTLDNPANPIVYLRNRIPSGLLRRIGAVPYYMGRTLGKRRLTCLLKDLGFKLHETDVILHCPRILAVWLAGWMEKHASGETQRKFLSLLMRFEKLSKLPTRHLTGYFIAVRCGV